jgi:hypothetical protein
VYAEVLLAPVSVLVTVLFDVAVFPLGAVAERLRTTTPF